MIIVIYSDLISDSKINEMDLSEHQKEWYSRFQDKRVILKDRFTKKAAIYSSKNKSRTDSYRYNEEMDLLNRLIEVFEKYYDPENLVVNKAEAMKSNVVVGTTNTYGGWEDFTPKRRAYQYLQSKSIEIIDAIITSLKTNKKSISQSDVFDAILDYFSDCVYTKSELNILIKLYQFALATHSFEISHRDNSHAHKLLLKGTYIDLYEKLTDDANLSCRARLYLNSFLSWNPGLTKASVHDLISKGYDQSLFSSCDKNFISKHLPTTSMGDFHLVINKMKNLQKKDFPL